MVALVGPGRETEETDRFGTPVAAALPCCPTPGPHVLLAGRLPCDCPPDLCTPKVVTHVGRWVWSPWRCVRRGETKPALGTLGSGMKKELRILARKRSQGKVSDEMKRIKQAEGVNSGEIKGMWRLERTVVNLPRCE